MTLSGLTVHLNVGPGGRPLEGSGWLLEFRPILWCFLF